jgi:hypothetical protein
VFLHDYTRRLLTLTLFFVLGPILTVLVLGVVVCQKSPVAVRKHEQTILNQTGLNVRIDSVSELSPGKTQYTNLRLVDPETKKTVLSCPELTITFVRTTNLKRFESVDTLSEDGETKTDNVIADVSNVDDNNADAEPVFVENRQTNLFDVITDYIPFYRSGAGFWRVTAPQMTVHFDRVPADVGGAQLKEFFFAMLAHRRGPKDAPLEFTVDTLEIKTPVEVRNDDASNTPLDLTLTFFGGRFYSTERSTRVDISWAFPNFPPSRVVAFHAIRSRTGSVPSTHITFSVPKDEYVPVTLLSLFLPQFEQLGELCRFSGTIQCDHLPIPDLQTGLTRETAWNVMWKEVILRRIDLKKFADEYTSFNLTGEIEIEVTSAIYNDSLVTANGWADIVNGTIERDLFQRLTKDFGLIVRPNGFIEKFPGEQIPFDKCLFCFNITPGEATFTSYKGSHKNLIMTTREGKVMEVSTQPTTTPIPIPTLLSSMVKTDTPSIPWTPGTAKIMGAISSETAPQTAAPSHPSQLPLPSNHVH